MFPYPGAPTAPPGYFGGLPLQAQIAAQQVIPTIPKTSGFATSRGICLTNLSLSVTEQDLHALFSPFGAIEKLQLSGTSAIVTFFDSTNAQAAMRDLYGKTLHATLLTMSWARPDQSIPLPQPVQNLQQEFNRENAGNPPNRTLWIGNLPPSATEQNLSAECGKCGVVEMVRIVPNKGCAFVTMQALDQAIAAKKHMQTKSICGSLVKVNFARDSQQIALGLTPVPDRPVAHAAIPPPSQPYAAIAPPTMHQVAPPQQHPGMYHAPPPPPSPYGAPQPMPYGAAPYLPPDAPMPTPTPRDIDPESLKLIDRTAEFCARNGPEAEIKIKEKQYNDPRFNFLFGGPEYSYYVWRLYCLRNRIPDEHAHQMVMQFMQRQQQQYYPPPPPPQPPVFPPSSFAPYSQAQVPQPYPPSSYHEQVAQPPQMDVGESQHAPTQDAEVPEKRMSQEEEQELWSLLEKLSKTKQSVMAAKSWMMEHESDAPFISYCIKKRMRELDETDRKLHLFYLVHDILCTSAKASTGGEPGAFSSGLAKHIKQIIRAACRRQSHDNFDKIVKVIKLWPGKALDEETCSTLEEVANKAFSASMEGDDSSPAPPRDSAEGDAFKDSLREQLSNLQQELSSMAQHQPPTSMMPPYGPPPPMQSQFALQPAHMDQVHDEQIEKYVVTPDTIPVGLLPSFRRAGDLPYTPINPADLPPSLPPVFPPDTALLDKIDEFYDFDNTLKNEPSRKRARSPQRNDSMMGDIGFRGFASDEPSRGSSFKPTKTGVERDREMIASVLEDGAYRGPGIELARPGIGIMGGGGEDEFDKYRKNMAQTYMTKIVQSKF